jgi:RNA polymerase sigma-70 factor (ECF subfamily)
MTEAELVALAAQGDQDAFGQLVRDNEKRVYNLALRMVGDPQDALDLSQEAFLNAWKGLSSFQGQCAFSTWLYRLTSNVCLDFLRSKKRRQDRMGSPLSLDEEGRSLPASPGALPQEQLEQRERAAALRRCLDGLSPHHRQILVLRELSGLSYLEISQVLGVDLGTVKSRVARARLALRKSLCQEGNFFSPAPSNAEEETERK